MNKIRLLVLLFCAFSVVVTGCDLFRQIRETAPAAKTPALVSVLAVLPGLGWTNVGPNPSKEYEILPIGAPGVPKGIKILFRAPYPSEIEVDVDGTVLEKTDNQDRIADLEAKGLGRYDTVRIGVPDNTAMSDWEIALVPPSGKRTGPRFEINIRNLSINPNLTGKDKVSDPLKILVVERRKFSLEVTKVGTGTGTVTSSPLGINCGSDCEEDYGSSLTVTLTTTASSDSRFLGWSGSCTGRGPCTVTLNGVAKMATATFERNYSTGNFTAMQQTSPCGYVASSTSDGKWIEISLGNTRIYSHLRQGQGSWDVWFNQIVCESAVIRERGVPMAAPSGRQRITMVVLGKTAASGRAVGSGDEANDFGNWRQSPDGLVLAVESQELSTSPWGDLTYYKAIGVNEGMPLGRADLSRCDPGIAINPWPRMENNNWVAVQCYGDPSRPWSKVQLQ